MARESCIRFWNQADECIKVNGEYLHYVNKGNERLFITRMLRMAKGNGAVCVDIDNEFYVL